MEKEYVKTLYATTHDDLFSLLKNCYSLGLLADVNQLQPVRTLYSWNERTFEIKVFTPSTKKELTE